MYRFKSLAITLLRYWQLTAVFVIFFATLISNWGNPKIETPEQIRVREMMVRIHQKEYSTGIESRRNLCAAKARCSAYGEARQTCATAGDFENCLQIKMGNEYSSARSQCVSNGKLNPTVASTPTAFDCAISWLPASLHAWMFH
jgi:hypothetical protein